ncbi:hypothetical protein RvY_13717 [Ramazzottius varieornatus]|uniref:Uncharacterized protein n=1 Tax=Ramazzottius varieornatus TaxID=947166 RepID=A0A1D1VXD1_RAMVA|nr:hypothetical protein RvY_13717 [Ramazzottius varieornatus]
MLSQAYSRSGKLDFSFCLRSELLTLLSCPLGSLPSVVIKMNASTLTFFLGFATALAVATASPVKKSTFEEYFSTKSGDACDKEGEIESADPCKPYCVCHEGSVVCAEITCTDDFELPQPNAVCSKLHVSPKTRCCHHYLCLLEDGTGTMVYPLPLVSAPDELYA